MKFLLLLTLITIFTSCQNEERFTQLNSIPYAQGLEESKGSVDFYIMTTHDIAGQIFPLVEKKKSQMGKQIFKTAGLSIIKSYYEIAKKRFDEQVILIGNGKTFDLNKNMKRQIKIIKELNYDVINLEGTEVNTLIEMLSLETLYPLPVFSSNIVNAANGEHFILSDQSLSSHKIIEKKGIKIGIINLSEYKSIPKDKSKKFKGIYFKDLVASTLKEVKTLREKEVNAIVVNINIQSFCKNQNLSFKSYNKNLKCPNKDPLKEYIERLPSNTVDLVIASGGIDGSGKIDGVPVIKEESKGRYLGVAKLSFDRETLSLEKNKLTLFPPLKTCHQFFAATKDCYFNIQDKHIVEERSKILENSAYLVIPAMFLGHEVSGDSTLEKMIYKQKTF